MTLQGSTSSYATFKSNAFTDPATAFAAVETVSAGRDFKACADNFKLVTSASVVANTAPPAAPTGLTALKGNQGWNSIELKWAKSAAKYSVYRGTAPGGEGETPIANDVVVPTFTDTNLSDGPPYYYKVRASNPNGSSASGGSCVVNPLYRDRTAYPSYSLNWNTSTDLRQATGVFPHSALVGRALATTQDGVFLTDDSGHAQIAPCPGEHGQGGPGDRRRFSSDQPRHVLSREQDQGHLGHDRPREDVPANWLEGEEYLASDTVTSLIVYPGDSSHQTLLAVHGDSAAGLSRSRDSGQTWDVVNTDNHFRRVFGAEGNSSQLYLFRFCYQGARYRERLHLPHGG